MKKLLLIWLIPILLLSCSKKSQVEISPEKPFDEKKISENVIIEDPPLYPLKKDDVLKIWVRSDFAPGMYIDEDGELKGYYVDLEKAIMEEMGQKYELIPYQDILQVIDAIKSNKGHSALGVPVLPDYESMSNISNTLLVLDYYMYLNEKSTNYDFVSNEDTIKYLFNKRVGVQARGHIYQQLIGYGQIELVEYPTTTFALEALDRGEVDAVFEDMVVGNYYAEKNNWSIKPVGDKIFSLEMGTGFSKALELSVIERYNKALEKLIKSGYVEELYSSYYN